MTISSIYKMIDNNCTMFFTIVRRKNAASLQLRDCRMIVKVNGQADLR